MKYLPNFRSQTLTMKDFFYCIVKSQNKSKIYYKGYYKPLFNFGSGKLYPAATKNISEALKLTFEEEAQYIADALGQGWKVKEISI